MAESGAFSFGEVAIHFNSEEWLLLDPIQKVLHEEVMLETSRMVASLGKGSSMRNLLKMISSLLFSSYINFTPPSWSSK
uniref:KRAB domain-containing protein n=1 Tax=Naja naja TaxID=35670 RepID=A0A8C6X1Y2_NAJNA